MPPIGNAGVPTRPEMPACSLATTSPFSQEALSHVMPGFDMIREEEEVPESHGYKDQVMPVTLVGLLTVMLLFSV